MTSQPTPYGKRMTSRVKSDLIALGRLGRSCKLFDKIIDAALDLLDVKLGLVHAQFELVDASYVGEPLEKHIAQGARRPLTKTGSLERLDPIAHRDDDIKVVERNWTTSHFRGLVQNLHKKHIVNVLRNDGTFASKQATHLILSQPDGFSVCLDLHFRLLVRLVNDNLLVHSTFVSRNSGFHQNVFSSAKQCPHVVLRWHP